MRWSEICGWRSGNMLFSGQWLVWRSTWGSRRQLRVSPESQSIHRNSYRFLPEGGVPWSVQRSDMKKCSICLLVIAFFTRDMKCETSFFNIKSLVAGTWVTHTPRVQRSLPSCRNWIFVPFNPFNKCSVEPKPQYPEDFRVAFMQMITCFCFCFPDSCRKQPSRPPRNPLRPNKASKQLPPEPNHVETDDVTKLHLSFSWILYCRLVLCSIFH